MLVEDMSRNKCFSQVRISHILRFISIWGLFTDSSTYKQDKPEYKSNNSSREEIQEAVWNPCYCPYVICPLEAEKLNLKQETIYLGTPHRDRTALIRSIRR
jgi:hypothetical protein